MPLPPQHTASASTRMTNLLILLTLTPELNNQYRDRLKAKFPELHVDLVDHHSKVGPYIACSRHIADICPKVERRRAAGRHQAQMGAGARHRRRQSDRPAGAAQRRHRHQHPRHSRRAGVGSRHRLDAGAGPRYSARAARSERPRMGALSGTACCTTRRSAFSASAPSPRNWRRNARRSACAPSVSVRRRAPSPASTAWFRAQNLPTWSANSISSCCSPRSRKKPATASMPKCSPR